MSILCLLGFHHRSRRRARSEGATYVSVCERCDKPMKKCPDGKWVTFHPTA